MLNNDYDSTDQRTNLTATVGGTNDFVNAYSYDADGRTTGIAQSGVTGGNTVAAKLVTMAYDPAGQLTSVKRYTDLAGTQAAPQTDYTYDNSDQLTALTQKQGTTAIAGYTWTYDNNGRVTAVTSPDGTTAFTYDANGQLKVVDKSVGYDEY